MDGGGEWWEAPICMAFRTYKVMTIVAGTSCCNVTCVSVDSLVFWSVRVRLTNAIPNSIIHLLVSKLNQETEYAFLHMRVYRVVPCAWRVARWHGRSGQKRQLHYIQYSVSEPKCLSRQFINIALYICLRYTGKRGIIKNYYRLTDTQSMVNESD